MGKKYPKIPSLCRVHAKVQKNIQLFLRNNGTYRQNKQKDRQFD